MPRKIKLNTDRTKCRVYEFPMKMDPEMLHENVWLKEDRSFSNIIVTKAIDFHLLHFRCINLTTRAN
jgi:hypothetical protein